MKENCNCTDCDCDEPNRIDTIWVGVFQFPGDVNEVIYAGYNPVTEEARASVEYSEIAIPALVEFCDYIVEMLKEKEGIEATYRLLKFSNPAEMNPLDNRGAESFVWTVKKNRTHTVH
jgi:hypothetical protein